jgi:hypothetical protein
MSRYPRSVAARRGVRRGQLPPGARRRGPEKRVVEAKEGGDKHDICPLAPETLAPPLPKITYVPGDQQLTDAFIYICHHYRNCHRVVRADSGRISCYRLKVRCSQRATINDRNTYLFRLSATIIFLPAQGHMLSFGRPIGK